MSFFGRLIDSFVEWVRSLFWKQEMELTLVGLQASGKTTLVNLISEGAFQEDMIPTVGFNMKKVTRGNVTIKVILTHLLFICFFKKKKKKKSMPALGYWWTTAIQIHVGKILSGETQKKETF